MSDIYAPGEQIELRDIPDDLTIPQFLLDTTHPLKPVNTTNAPWLIDDASGRKVGLEEVSVQFRAVPVVLADARVSASVLITMSLPIM